MRFGLFLVQAVFPSLVMALGPRNPPLIHLGLPVFVEAAPSSAYLAKCHIRTFKGPDGLYANTYYIDAKGRFRDFIPSPNAQCVFGLVKGQGPATLHILKHGDHAASVSNAGQWVRLDVW